VEELPGVVKKDVGNQLSQIEVVSNERRGESEFVGECRTACHPIENLKEEGYNTTDN